MDRGAFEASRCPGPPTSTRRSSTASAKASGGPSGSSSGARPSSPSPATSSRSTSPASRSSSFATGRAPARPLRPLPPPRVPAHDRGPAPRPATCDAPGRVGRFRGVIRCVYHSWCYELDGRVRNAPFLGEATPSTRRLRAPPRGARHVGRLALRQPRRPSAVDAGHTLARQLGEIPAGSPATRSRTCGPPAGSCTTSRANWKVIVENYNECYHCSGVHPEPCRIVPAFKERGGADLDWDDGIPQAEGTFTFTAVRDERPRAVPRPDPEEQVRHKGELVYPNLMLSLSADHVAAFTLLPQAPDRDPRRRRLPVPPGRDGETRPSTPRTPSSSGTWSTARTGRSASPCSPGCRRAASGSGGTRRWRT